jgi:hypothetical protein
VNTDSWLPTGRGTETLLQLDPFQRALIGPRV